MQECVFVKKTQEQMTWKGVFTIQPPSNKFQGSATKMQLVIIAIPQMRSQNTTGDITVLCEGKGRKGSN